jgi:hypothetical protein
MAMGSSDQLSMGGGFEGHIIALSLTENKSKPGFDINRSMRTVC